MKQKCFLLASLFAAALPSAAVMAQAEGDDFTSHIVNAGFDEGPDLERSFATGNRGTFYAPVGWDVVYHASDMAYGSQHFNMNQYSADAPGANGMTTEDTYTVPLLIPEGDGYYQHVFSGAYNSPILTISQTISDLPAGNGHPGKNFRKKAVSDERGAVLRNLPEISVPGDPFLRQHPPGKKDGGIPGQLSGPPAPGAVFRVPSIH